VVLVDMLVMVAVVELATLVLVVQAVAVVLVVVVGRPTPAPKITVEVAQDYMDRVRMVQVAPEMVAVAVVRWDRGVVMVELVAYMVVELEVVKMIQIAVDRSAAAEVPESFGVLVDRTHPRIRRMYKYKNLTSY
jgi:hypothetical protein